MFWRRLGALNKDVCLQTSKHRAVGLGGWGCPIRNSVTTTPTSVLPDNWNSGLELRSVLFSPKGCRIPQGLTTVPQKMIWFAHRIQIHM